MSSHCNTYHFNDKNRIKSVKNSNFHEIAYFQTLKKDVKIGPYSLKIVGIGGLEIEEQNKHKQYCVF